MLIASAWQARQPKRGGRHFGVRRCCAAFDCAPQKTKWMSLSIQLITNVVKVEVNSKAPEHRRTPKRKRLMRARAAAVMFRCFAD